MHTHFESKNLNQKFDSKSYQIMGTYIGNIKIINILMYIICIYNMYIFHAKIIKIAK